MWISLKFDSIGYMPYLRQILTSKPQKSPRNTCKFYLVSQAKFGLRYFIKFDGKFDVRRGSAKFNLHAVQQQLTCSGVREGLGEEGATLRK
nr:hypothetical protein [uncultured Campylobacter sp.]